VHARNEEDLGAVDVAHPRPEALVHQQQPHALLGGAHPLPERVGVGVGPQRVLTQLGALPLEELKAT